LGSRLAADVPPLSAESEYFLAFIDGDERARRRRCPLIDRIEIEIEMKVARAKAM